MAAIAAHHLGQTRDAIPRFRIDYSWLYGTCEKTSKPMKGSTVRLKCRILYAAQLPLKLPREGERRSASARASRSWTPNEKAERPSLAAAFCCQARRPPRGLPPRGLPPRGLPPRGLPPTSGSFQTESWPSWPVWTNAPDPAARGRAGIASTARQAGDGQAHLTKSICPCAAGRYFYEIQRF